MLNLEENVRRHSEGHFASELFIYLLKTGGSKLNND